MGVLDGFHVLEVPRTFSIAEAKVLRNKISFNIAAASELGYPAFVRMFISNDKTQLALQPCSKETQNAMKFFTNDFSKQKRKALPVGNRALVTLVKTGMNWRMEDTQCIRGIRFAEENVLIFDLRQAYTKGDQSPASKGICTIPTLANRFVQIPTEYFGAVSSQNLLGDGLQNRFSRFDTEIIDVENVCEA